MDFAIDTSADGAGMTFSKAGTILNNVYLSLMVCKGSFFQNPEFGSRLHLLQRAKNTDKTAEVAVGYAKEALQWMIDTGKAKKVEVFAERDRAQILDRLKLLVEVTPSFGPVVTFSTFVEVA